MPPDGAIVFAQACKLGCEGIVSKRIGSLYRSGRSRQWFKVKNKAAPAVPREAEESGDADAANEAAPHDVSAMLPTAERKRTSWGLPRWGQGGHPSQIRSASTGAREPVERRALIFLSRCARPDANCGLARSRPSE